MAEQTYVHIWEIVDDTLPLSALRLEANRELGALLNRRGVVATDRPRYTVAEDRLVVEVPVDRVAPDVDEEAVLRRLLREAGYGDPEVTDGP